YVAQDGAQREGKQAERQPRSDIVQGKGADQQTDPHAFWERRRAGPLLSPTARGSNHAPLSPGAMTVDLSSLRYALYRTPADTDRGHARRSRGQPGGIIAAARGAVEGVGQSGTLAARSRVSTVLSVARYLL